MNNIIDLICNFILYLTIFIQIHFIFFEMIQEKPNIRAVLFNLIFIALFGLICMISVRLFYFIQDYFIAIVLQIIFEVIKI